MHVGFPWTPRKCNLTAVKMGDLWQTLLSTFLIIWIFFAFNKLCELCICIQYCFTFLLVHFLSILCYWEFQFMVSAVTKMITYLVIRDKIISSTKLTWLSSSFSNTRKSLVSQGMRRCVQAGFTRKNSGAVKSKKKNNYLEALNIKLQNSRVENEIATKILKIHKSLSTDIEFNSSSRLKKRIWRQTM